MAGTGAFVVVDGFDFKIGFLGRVRGFRGGFRGVQLSSGFRGLDLKICYLWALSCAFA